MDAVKHAVFPQVAGRIPSIDAARAIAIFAVLAIHCDPFIGPVYSLGGVSLGELIDLAGRFAGRWCNKMSSIPAAPDFLTV